MNDMNLKPTLDEYQLIWENTNDAIIVLRDDGAIIQANPAFTEILGWRLEEVEGLVTFPFFMESFTKENHEKQLALLRDGQHIENYETKRRHKDGSTKDILASYRAINKNQVLAVAMYKDITEENKVKHKLKVTEDCYEALVEYSPDAILVQNDEEIYFANPAAIKLLGAKDLTEVIGKSMNDFVDKKQMSKQQRFTEKLVKRNVEPIIERFVRFDGVKIWVEIIALPLKYDGEVVIQAVLRDVTVRKYYEDQLRYMATYDPMTGVVNRASFIKVLDEAIEQANDSQEIFAVLYLDLDKFKDVNDAFGHNFGDELLIQFAERLGANIRHLDVVGRVGGDEFLILLRNVTQEKVGKIVERMHKNLNASYNIQGHEIVATSSIGIAMCSADVKDSETLIHHADQALYKAKERRNYFKFYNETFREDS